jgi:Protein of unknown function (DUF2950)
MQIIGKDFKKTRQYRSIEAVSLAFFLFFTTGLSLAQQVSQKTFSSAENASQSLFGAVKSGDAVTIMQILGESKHLVSSGDDLEDKHDRQLFAQKYEEMHRLVEEADGTTLLYIGAENWPFPIPLVSKQGVWLFDPDAGAKEVLFRRVGENEARTIKICQSLAVKRTGAEANNDAAVQFAGTQQSPNPLHGYYFRKLVVNSTGTAQKFIVVAYPAEYRSSGVMTFVGSQNGVLYEKDLGPQTVTIVMAMTTWKPDRSWHIAR